MKTLNKTELEKISGGSAPSTRSCTILGGITLIYAAAQQWGWALGTIAGAAGAGCFDN
ncbi:MAG: class IIb bacteriocin, lactobin A/cerein 7B family [Sediminibacterium sp.]